MCGSVDGAGDYAAKSICDGARMAILYDKRFSVDTAK